MHYTESWSIWHCLSSVLPLSMMMRTSPGTLRASLYGFITYTGSCLYYHSSWCNSLKSHCYAELALVRSL